VDSKRLATLKALTQHLSDEVAVANDYQHDLAGAVFRGRMFFDKDDPVPCVSILDNINSDRFPVRAGNEDTGDGEAKSNWILLINGWAKDDKVNPTDPAEQLMADVKKALAKIGQGPHPMDADQSVHANYMLDGLIAGIEFEPGTVRPPDENSSLAYFWMRVILKFTENVSDPFDRR
jgi:hypothetical protein